MSRKTSENALYSAHSPDIATDLLCIDRPGEDSYKATIAYIHSLLHAIDDLRYMVLDDGSDTYLTQTIFGMFAVRGDQADFPNFIIQDTTDPSKAFGAGINADTAYFYATDVFLEFQFTGNPLGQAAGSGYLGFTMVPTPNNPYAYVLTMRPGVGETYGFGKGGIIELFGNTPGVTGGQRKLLMVNAASAAPAVNPPAGSVFMYLDPADGEMKYRKPDGTVRLMRQ